MGMYCRKCDYDLREQKALRCPECGTDFDPGDPKSFFEYPGRLHRVGIALRKSRTPIVVLLTSSWALCMLFGPLRLHARVHHNFNTGAHRSVLNLKMIMWQRIAWHKEELDDGTFERKAALRDLPPGNSPWSDQIKSKWRRRLPGAMHVAGEYAILTAVYALLLIPLVRRRQRWIAVGVLAPCLALFYASLNAWSVAYALLPPSHAYLDDYVYIDGIQFTSSDDESNTMIAAYDIRSFEGNQRRIVAFANGHVVSMRDDRVRPLFEAQGLEYPTNSKAGTGEQENGQENETTSQEESDNQG